MLRSEEQQSKREAKAKQKAKQKRSKNRGLGVGAQRLFERSSAGKRREFSWGRRIAWLFPPFQVQSDPAPILRERSTGLSSLALFEKLVEQVRGAIPGIGKLSNMSQPRGSAVALRSG